MLGKPAYPSKAIVMRYLDAVHETGAKVGGCEVLRDGTIRVLTETNAPRQSVSAYDEWKAKKAKQA